MSGNASTSPRKGTRVTSEDIETGEREEVVITDNWVVVCDGKYELVHVNSFSNGTVVITVKPTRVLDP